MVSFKDGSSSASDNDIIRTQIESLLEIMLVQVNNRKKKIILMYNSELFSHIQIVFAARSLL